MPVPPFPTIPSPRTWSPGDQILTRYLRADLSNAALMLAQRPLFFGGQTTLAQSLPANAWTPVNLDTEFIDAYEGHNGVTNNASWTCPDPSSGPLSGWYLIEGKTEVSSIPNTSSFGVGLRVVQSGVTTDQFCGIGVGNGAGSDVASTGATLAQLDATQADRCSMLANPATSVPVVEADFKAEWVGVSGGTVVSSPSTAALAALGSGTAITNAGGIAAGATSMTVADPTGMVVGGTLGLDYLNGAQVSPMAETVTITSVAGSTIGITATLYPHGGAASPGNVAVPVSAAWLNKQARDMIRFLTYPPMAHLFVSSSATSLPTQTFPAGTSIPFTASKIDNFGGWGGGGSGVYTVPVGGVYYVYGQVAASSATGYTLSAGLQVNAGTIQWGGSLRNPSNTQGQAMIATVRRHLRVNAGDTIQLYCSQNSGAALSLRAGFQQCSRLIVVFRSF